MRLILGNKNTFGGALLILALFGFGFAVCGTQNKDLMLRADLPADYAQMKGCAKRDFLFDSNIKPTAYTELPPLKDLDIKWLLTHYLNMWPKLIRTQDTVARGWTKFIHAHSTVAKVKWVSDQNHDYSGVFEGHECGLMRFSLTYDPKKRGVAPGLALKFLNDGFDSSDISLLTSLDSQGQDYDWLKKPFTNAVPQGKGFGAKIVYSAFRIHSKFPTRLSLADLGRTKKDQVAKVPVQIFLKSSQRFDSTPARDFRVDFSQLKSGNALFDVYAFEGEAQEFERLTAEQNEAHLERSRKIGQIVLESEFLPSEFGDQILFFKHRDASN